MLTERRDNPILMSYKSSLDGHLKWVIRLHHSILCFKCERETNLFLLPKGDKELLEAVVMTFPSLTADIYLLSQHKLFLSFRG